MIVIAEDSVRFAHSGPSQRFLRGPRNSHQLQLPLELLQPHPRNQLSAVAPHPPHRRSQTPPDREPPNEDPLCLPVRRHPQTLQLLPLVQSHHRHKRQDLAQSAPYLRENSTMNRNNHLFSKIFLQDNWEMWGKCGENRV